MLCFECGLEAVHNHHVIPQSLGGTKTIPLCESCHGKVHDMNLMNWKALQRAGIDATRGPNGKCPWGGRKEGTRVKLTEEKEKAILEMKAMGVSIADMARNTGLCRQTVYKALGLWKRED